MICYKQDWHQFFGLFTLDFCRPIISFYNTIHQSHILMRTMCELNSYGFCVSANKDMDRFAVYADEFPKVCHCIRSISSQARKIHWDFLKEEANLTQTCIQHFTRYTYSTQVIRTQHSKSKLKYICSKCTRINFIFFFVFVFSGKYLVSLISESIVRAGVCKIMF